MGCTDSRVIEVSSQTNVKLQQKSQSKAAPNDKSKPDTYTVKDFFDTILTVPETDGTPYTQPQLPNHYMQHEITFQNDNVDNEIWNKKLKVDKKSKVSKDATKKGKDDEITWHYRKLPNRKYTEPENVFKVHIEFEQGSKKKQVIVVGGLYLGSAAASQVNIFEQINVETTHSLVILGNLFDTLSYDAFHQKPSDITEIETALADSESALSSLRKLAESVDVYYLRGSHDFKLTRVAIERLLGDKVRYVQEKYLLMLLKVENECYRVRLMTGQEWDILSFREGLSGSQLLVDEPIGSYLARAASANPKFSISALIRPIISSIPSDLSAQFLQQISKRPLQDKLTEKMLLAALQLTQSEDLIDIKCLVDEGKYIGVQSIVEYPFIKYTLEQVGEEKLMSMLKAMIGDYSEVAKSFQEDVLIVGLGEEATLSKVLTDSGQDIVCASTGSCSLRSDKLTTLCLTFPKQGSNGKVEIITPKATETITESTSSSQVQKTEIKEDEDTISVESL